MKKKKHEKYISNVATDIFFPMHAVFLKILFFLKIIIINLFQFFFTCINSIVHQIIYSSYISEDFLKVIKVRTTTLDTSLFRGRDLFYWNSQSKS